MSADSVYLDCAATTMPSEAALDAFLTASRECFANPQSVHAAGLKTERLITEAAKEISGSLGCDKSELVFTSGGTESNNLAILGHVPHSMAKHIVTSAAEHPSVTSPLKVWADRGVRVDAVKTGRFGVIDLGELEKAISAETSLVSVIHINNETGAVNNIEEIGALVKRKNPKTIFHVDAVQAFCKLDINVPKAKIDLLSISSHKINGVKGTGALYVRKGVILKPLFCGGSQQAKLRPGTENAAGIRSFASAVQKADIEHLRRLNDKLRSGLSGIAGTHINSPESGFPGILNVSFPGIRAEVMVNALSAKGIYISAGAACSAKDNYKTVLMRTGEPKNIYESSVRISFDGFNTEADIERLIIALNELIPVLTLR